MKRTLIISLISILISINVSAQKLIDIYKNGPVKLTPDKTFAQGNNWGEVFRCYNDTLYNKHIGKRKSIKIFPNGNIAINHSYKKYYTLFSPNGKFIKEPNLKKENGEIRKKASVTGILDDKVFYHGLDNMGNLRFFDYNGNWIKTIVLDYMAKQIITLPNKKIAVVGWVIWSDRFRDFVSIVDYETGEETIIWEHYTKRNKHDISHKNQKFKYGYRFKEGGAMSVSTMPFNKYIGLRPAPAIYITGNELIVTLPALGEFHKYDLTGSFISKGKVNWEQPELSIEEQKDIQAKAIENVEKNILNLREAPHRKEKLVEAYKAILPSMKADLNKIDSPIKMPYFSTCIKDSDNNLLFFVDPENEGENKFNVYTFNENGQFVCQSTFICGDYKLVINNDKLLFKDGYLYGIQELKEANGIPLRLVRFKLSN